MIRWLFFHIHRSLCSVIKEKNMRSLSLLAFLAAFLTLLLSSCRCPPDEEIGQIGLTEQALQFLPYDGSETLQFQDPQGNRLSFSAPQGEERGEDQVCIRTICTEARYNSPSSCEYFLADNRRYVFVSEDKERLIDLLIYTALYRRDSEDFFDALQVGYSSGTPSIEAGWIIQQRFSGTLDPDDTNIAAFFRPEEELVLNGQTFEDVLHFSQNGLGVYLQAGKGVIALEESGRVWLLQE
jgi:hypothetical protein